MFIYSFTNGLHCRYDTSLCLDDDSRPTFEEVYPTWAASVIEPLMTYVRPLLCPEELDDDTVERATKSKDPLLNIAIGQNGYPILPDRDEDGKDITTVTRMQAILHSYLTASYSMSVTLAICILD